MNPARSLALLLLLAGARLAGLAPADARLPLPPATGPLEFEPGATEIGVDELLQRLARLTGQELAMSAMTQQVLRATKEPLETAAPVPAGEVYAFVEGHLARQGIVIAPITRGTRPILGVRATDGRPDGNLDPLYVEAGALGELAGHPALFVRVLVRMKYVDTRQVQTQLRQLVVDASGTQQMVPVGEHALILQGRGSDVAAMASLLQAADEAAAHDAPPAPKPESGEAK